MSSRSARAARGRRIRHLTTRSFSSLAARPLDGATTAWVAEILEPGERAVWSGMSRADRAEGVAVARAFGEDDSRWLAAALLHDAGKQVSGYGTFGRVCATLVTAGAGKSRVRSWADGPGRLRGRVGRYAAHDDLGAELLRRAGARAEVAAWAAAHHRPDRWAGTGIPEAVCRKLAEADGEL
jgi:putative nucleotidyltransferase with HDIG domain